MLTVNKSNKMAFNGNLLSTPIVIPAKIDKLYIRVLVRYKLV